MFFYFLYRLGHFFANILPVRIAYWLAERISDIHYYISKRDRHSVAKNLSIILNKDINECNRLAHNVFRNFGLYMVDFFRMDKLDKDFIDRHVDIIGLENIDEILKQGKGLVAVTSHLGNWEMGGVIMAVKGYSISAVALNHAHRKINEFFIRQRQKKGLKVIPIDSAARRCVSALLRKDILGLVGDRDFMDTGIVVDFFGVPTSIPRGPALLSIKTQSPIVPGFLVRDGRMSYKLIFEKPITVDESFQDSEEDRTRQITERFVRVMERYIRMYPEQWLVFRRFWESPVDAFIL